MSKQKPGPKKKPSKRWSWNVPEDVIRKAREIKKETGKPLSEQFAEAYRVANDLPPPG